MNKNYNSLFLEKKKFEGEKERYLNQIIFLKGRNTELQKIMKENFQKLNLGVYYKIKSRNNYEFGKNIKKNNFFFDFYFEGM
jgi:hypothetical protein